MTFGDDETLADRHLAALYRESERESVIQRLTADSRGAWYLIRCAPGRDTTALQWLARRRFAVFLAMTGLRRIAPGWLAAYVFDIADHEARIRSTPGVMGILRGHDDAPLVVQAEFIRNLQRATWSGTTPLPKPKPRRPAKKRLRGGDRRRMKKLKRAAKRAQGGRLLDIRAQISALRDRIKAPSACGHHAA